MRHDAWDRIAASHPVDASLVLRNVREKLHVSSDDDGVDPELRVVYRNLVVAVDSILESQASNKVGELCSASAAGDVFAMRRILAGGFDADSSDYYGRTPLHAAAAHGMVVSVRFLLEYGASPDIRDASGVTPLFEAVRNGHSKCAAMIAEAGGTLQVPSGGAGGGNAVAGQLHVGQLMSQVCATGDSKLLKSLLDNGLDPRVADLDGRTGLHVAAERGAHVLVSELLRAGADPSQRDAHGFTPLLEAVRRGHVSVAHILCDAGATLGLDSAGDADAGGGGGLPGPTAGRLSADAELSSAVHRGQLEYLRLLLEFGADANAADVFDGRTAARAPARPGPARPRPRPAARCLSAGSPSSRC